MESIMKMSEAAGLVNDDEGGIPQSRPGRNYTLPLKLSPHVYIEEHPNTPDHVPLRPWEINNLPLLDHSAMLTWVFIHGRQRIVWFNTHALQRYWRPPSMKEEVILQNSSAPPEVIKGCCEYMDAIHKLVEVQHKTVKVTAMEDCILPGWRRTPPTDRYQIKLVVKPMKLCKYRGDTLMASLVMLTEELSGTELRSNCIHKMTRIFRIMFDKSGKLLSCHGSNVINGVNPNMCFRDLFSPRSSSTSSDTSDEDIQRVYEQAWHAIFMRKTECYCLPQLCESNKRPGQQRCALFEMGPMEDPVTKETVALVTIYNLGWLKEQLDKMHDYSKRIGQIAIMARVQRTQLEKACNKLDKHNQKLAKENNQLKHVAEAAEAQLEEVLQSLMTIPSSQFDTETPAEKTSALLRELMKGNTPNMEKVVELHDAIMLGGDLHKPMNLGQQLKEGTVFAKDVSLAMLDLLVGTSPGADDDREDGNGSDTDGLFEAGSVATQGKAMLSPDDGMELLKDIATSPRNEKGEGSCESMLNQLQSTSRVGSDQTFKALLSRHGKSVPNSLMPELERMLGKVNDWQFDTFKLAEASHGYPLSMLGIYLIICSGIADALRLDKEKLARFLVRIENNYPNNPYHNHVHAADVLQSTHVIMLRSGLWNRIDNMTVLNTYIAAIIHDYEHKGVSNEYLIRSRDPLAILYNDHSPQENHHLAAAFKLLYQDEYNFTSNLSRKEQDRTRSQVVELVMSTDMKQHFNILSQLQAKMSGYDESVTMQNELLEDNQRLVLQVGLKCADVGHLKSTAEVHQRWVRCLEEEFFQQGDMEKKNGMPVSPLMDRCRVGVTKSQVGFFEIVAIPLFKTFTDILPGAVPVLEALMENYNYWREEEAKVMAEAAIAKAAKDAQLSKDVAEAQSAAGVPPVSQMSGNMSTDVVDLLDDVEEQEPERTEL